MEAKNASVVLPEIYPSGSGPLGFYRVSQAPLDQPTLDSSVYAMHYAQVMFLPTCMELERPRRGRDHPALPARDGESSYGAGNPDLPRNEVAPLVDVEPIKASWALGDFAEFAVLPRLRLVRLRGTPVGSPTEGRFLSFVLVDTRQSFISPYPGQSELLDRGTALHVYQYALFIGSCHGRIPH